LRLVRIAYVILLPDEVHNFMRRVQADLYGRYDASLTTLALEPHITLKQPFDSAELGPYELFFDRLAGETDPFELALRGFGFFEEEGVVFLDLEQDARLLALQRRILDELGLEPAEYESGLPVPYHFHATIAAELAPEDLEDARSRLAETPEFRITSDRLGFFLRSEERPWIVYKRAKL
jgi:2'-5' RNA ligase